MMYSRCKCGKSTSVHSGYPDPPCHVCPECGSTLASHPDQHKEPQPHKWEQRYDPATGEPTLRRCRVCREKDHLVGQAEVEAKGQSQGDVRQARRHEERPARHRRADDPHRDEGHEREDGLMTFWEMLFRRRARSVMETQDTEQPWVTYAYFVPDWLTRVLGRTAVRVQCSVCGDGQFLSFPMRRVGEVAPATGQHPLRHGYKSEHRHPQRSRNRMLWVLPLRGLGR